MNQLNNVLLEGIVVDPPKELARAREGEKWGSFVKFEMVSSRLYRNRRDELIEEKLWIGVQCWGRIAENVLGHLEKRCPVRVVGRLKLNTWKGRDGKERRDMEIVASHLEYRRPDNDGKYGKDRKSSGKGGARAEDTIILDDGGEMARTGEPEFIYTYD